MAPTTTTDTTMTPSTTISTTMAPTTTISTTIAPTTTISITMAPIDICSITKCSPLGGFCVKLSETQATCSCTSGFSQDVFDCFGTTLLYCIHLQY